ncbi:hypothetical protein NL676_016802 [Syzygium grande]|nr:hypothetical protein NL676_016802 [Syzygium grande]
MKDSGFLIALRRLQSFPNRHEPPRAKPTTFDFIENLFPLPSPSPLSYSPPVAGRPRRLLLHTPSLSRTLFSPALTSAIPQEILLDLSWV